MNTMATASMPSALAASRSRAHRGEIGRALHRAVGAHALVDFGDALVEHVGLDDFARENLRPRLVADLERVAETLGDQAAACGRPCARAAHWWQPWCPSSPRRRGRAGSARRLQAEQIADALHGGVGIGFRVFREQLVRDQRAVRPPPHHVGEGAAAVDPEIPASACLAFSPCTLRPLSHLPPARR